MHEIDGAFRERRERSAQRRKSRRRRRVAAAAGLVALAAAGVGGLLTRGLWMPSPPPPVEVAEDETPVDAEEPVQPSFVPAILDLAGDPLFISIGAGTGGPKLKTLARPIDLLEPGISERIYLLSDTMLSSSERFMTTLPSSPEDFAFFQAQSGRVGPREPDPQADAPPFDDPVTRAPDEITQYMEEPVYE